MRPLGFSPLIWPFQIYIHQICFDLNQNKNTISQIVPGPVTMTFRSLFEYFNAFWNRNVINSNS